MKIGWIGLGRMGRPMVENLVSKGFDVTAQNRSQEKVHELAAKGAKVGGAYSEMAADAGILHLCLADMDTVRAVMTANDGVLAGAKPGLVIVDHSTNHPDFSREMTALAQAKGVAYLDAPVSGSGPVAERGELTIMVGGDRDAFQSVLPALEAMSRTAQHMGSSGAGSITKLINNVMMTTNLAVAQEALVLATKVGLDPDALVAVVKTASGNSRAWERNAPRALAREYGKDGGIWLVDKDLVEAKALAEEMGVDMPVFFAAQAQWADATQTDIAYEDPSHRITLVEQQAGTEVRGKH